MSTKTSNASDSTGWWAAILTWLVPGLGHFLLGRRGKGILFFVMITTLYVWGMVLSDFLNVNQERHPIYFIAEAFYGLATLVAMVATQSLRIESFNPFHDVGLLFTATAGLLNIVVIVDIYETLHPRPAAAAKGEDP